MPPNPKSLGGQKNLLSFFKKKEKAKHVSMTSANPMHQKSPSKKQPAEVSGTPSTASVRSHDEKYIEPSPHEGPKYPIGTKVRKEFEGAGCFDGSLVSYDSSEGFYCVRYEDSDSEEYTQQEFEAILLSNSQCDTKKPAPRPGKRQKVITDESEEKFREEEGKSVEVMDTGSDASFQPEEIRPKAAKTARSNEAAAPGRLPKSRKLDDSSSIQKKKPTTIASGWAFLDGMRTPKTAKTTIETKGKKAKSAYCAGDDLPVISQPQEMFDDMISTQLAASGKHVASLKALMKTLHGRPLKVATMCSGTESPLLALDMLTKSIEDFLNHSEGGDDLQFDTLLQVKHVFSCEIEPFKQAYIERNFQPPLLFRDIRELGKDEAFTAYGSLAKVPNDPGMVDILIAGTSCVDYSNLNTQKKGIQDKGESGQTWRGLIDWIRKAEPPIVILENVDGAPWKKKVEIFNELGYFAHFVKMDTKHYYVPQTRKRGYLFAIRRGPGASNSTTKAWEQIVRDLKRPASAALDGFMFSNDDPRVLRGRARLMGPGGGDSSEANNRVDWVRCEARHQFCRSDEELGDKRPLTGWSDDGMTSMPGFMWNEWLNRQVHRIHDLLDVNTLRLAKEGIDASYKTMVWNVSQNVDRDTMGKLGLCSCLTPTGVPYVTARGGPLVGEGKHRSKKACRGKLLSSRVHLTTMYILYASKELLLLQGIPCDDLILTRESERQLKDLAGNAMSTTCVFSVTAVRPNMLRPLTLPSPASCASCRVVGACILGALLVSHKVIDQVPAEFSTASIAMGESLVPRALQPVPKDITISQQADDYTTSRLMLGPLLFNDNVTPLNLSLLLKEASSASRKCTAEGADIAIPHGDLLRCETCSHTSSKSCAEPARKFEEHNFVPETQVRVDPVAFRSRLMKLLPMSVQIRGVNVEGLSEEVACGDTMLWKAWKQALHMTVYRTADTERGAPRPVEFRFSRLARTHLWTAFFTAANGSRLELRLSDNKAVWLLFAKAPSKRGPLRDALIRPVARMYVCPTNAFSLTAGSWQYCLPFEVPLELSFSAVGKRVQSWRARLGLKGRFSGKTQPEIIRVSGEAMSPDQKRAALMICGDYVLLPKCGGACGSLHKRRNRESAEEVGDLFFFLESGRKTLADNDCYVFSSSKHRTDPTEYREIIVRVDPEFRPEESLKVSDNDAPKTVRAYLPGTWADAQGLSLDAVAFPEPTFLSPSDSTTLTASMGPGGWKLCPELLCCELPISHSEPLSLAFEKRARGSRSVALNLRKSKKVFDELAFVTCRLSLPEAVSRAWQQLVSTGMNRVNGEEQASTRCSPRPPDIHWKLVRKGRQEMFVPIEDGQQAAVYEQALKRRPNPWHVVISKDTGPGGLKLHIGFNAASLAHRALGLLPRKTQARRAMLLTHDTAYSRDCLFEWRVVQHIDQDVVLGAGRFPKLKITSNRRDQQASQPPGFNERFPLRPEQLRSLMWMLSQEASSSPFIEEEVCEELLPSLDWRAESRVRRPVLVRGGVVADEVGYGKTCITLALHRAAVEVNGKERGPPEELRDKLFSTRATLIIVPSHLQNQWPREVEKFLGPKTRAKTCVVKDMASLNKLTIEDLLSAELVIINFSVLSGDKYFSRLARLAGVRASGMPSAKKAGSRHFDSIYNECLAGIAERVPSIRSDTENAYQEIERDAVAHSSMDDDEIRMDGKKSVYRSISEEETKKTTLLGEKKSSISEATLPSTELDPWHLKTKSIQKNYRKMRCPPLEMFFWNRVVCDEFTYLEKEDRARVLTLFRGLNASYRWCLSGTPPRETFDDAAGLAKLIGIHLGIDFPLPGASNGKRGQDKDRSETEKFSSLLESRSMQWHEQRHSLAQRFFDRFVRQNIAEIDEIKCEEHTIAVDLPPAERAIYLELDSHLRSLEMNGKRALKSRKSSTGDRERRMQMALEGSGSAEEALLKRCAHFNVSHGATCALEMCESVIKLRRQQKEECERDLVDLLAAAIRQRVSITATQPDWKGTSKTEKGEVQDRLEMIIKDVENMSSVSGGADREVNERLIDLLYEAQVAAKKDPSNPDIDYFNSANRSKKRKSSENTDSNCGNEDVDETSEDSLYTRKYQLREHCHKIRAAAKELCGRMRSLRYIEKVLSFQLASRATICCPGSGSPQCICSEGNELLPQDKVAVFSCCGHVGCIGCLRYHADRSECIDSSCKAAVKQTHIATAAQLGTTDKTNSSIGHFGAKLSAIVNKVEELVKSGDRVIVFVQFDDLKTKVKEALTTRKIQSLTVKGTTQQKSATLDILQKENPTKNDARVLLLTMDDESSAGINLTTCNHAIFVHPLLADSQAAYEAYETQSIGRIRRYGQMKTVHIWRYLARNTIDTEIFKKRTGVDIDNTASST